jgi:hypothetical protein
MRCEKKELMAIQGEGFACDGASWPFSGYRCTESYVVSC